MEKKDAFVLWFDEIGIEDVPLVGGKNASLGEMYRNLTAKGVPVPGGFAVTARGYRHLLDSSGPWTGSRASCTASTRHGQPDGARRAHPLPHPRPGVPG